MNYRKLLYIGGALAIVAILAIILKTILLGFSFDSLFDMLIDLGAMAVSLIVLFVVIRHMKKNGVSE